MDQQRSTQRTRTIATVMATGGVQEIMEGTRAQRCLPGREVGKVDGSNVGASMDTYIGVFLPIGLYCQPILQSSDVARHVRDERE